MQVYLIRMIWMAAWMNWTLSLRLRPRHSLDTGLARGIYRTGATENLTAGFQMLVNHVHVTIIYDSTLTCAYITYVYVCDPPNNQWLPTFTWIYVYI